MTLASTTITIGAHCLDGLRKRQTAFRMRLNALQHLTNRRSAGLVDEPGP